MLRQLWRFHWTGSASEPAGDPRQMTPAFGEVFDLDQTRRGALSLDPATPLRLLERAVQARVEPARSALADEIGELSASLRALLELDRRSHLDADGLATEMGELGARFLDAASLAVHVGSDPADALGEDRRRRIEEALADLATWEELSREPPLVVVHEPSRELPAVAGEGWYAIDAPDPWRAAREAFDHQSERLAGVLRAARRARLEIAGDYDPARHDPWLAELDWQGFDHRELMLLPRVAVWTDADTLAAGMLDASRLLLSGRPVQVLVTVDPSASPGAGAGDRLSAFRFEPGYVGLSLREAVVQQTTVAHPQHMLRGFARAVAAHRAGLHVIATVTSEAAPEGMDGPDREPAYRRLAAAVAGRAHPLFFYDPGAGRGWAQRLDFEGNPQPGDDWPSYRLNGSGDPSCFTFAAYAAFDSTFAGHFRTVEDEFPEADLLAVDAWLELPDDEATGKLPWVTAFDGDGRPRRAVISRQLALACRDRLDFWRTLQELAGERSEYADRAAEAARRAASAEHAAEMERLRAEHARELEEVRAEAARDVVERLMASLLNEVVPGAVVPGAVAPATSPELPAFAPEAVVPAVSEPATPPPVQPAPEVREEAVPEEAPTSEAEAPGAEDEEVEPYIDTELCTSCNDCLGINPRIFAYNADKKAFIADPTAGPFKDLVLAAEKCPAKIIHPGTPLDPDEPDLEPWIARAARFN